MTPLINGLLNLLFPVDCVVCGNSVQRYRSGPLCPACESLWTPLGPPFCERCGFPLTSFDTECGACITGSTKVDLGRSALDFDEGLRQVIHHFKYNDRVSLYN